jgi:hypothetical protein
MDMWEQAAARLTDLRRDYQLGGVRLAELKRQETALREALMRVSGAIAVLEELLAAPSRPGEPARSPEPGLLHVS